MGTSFSPEFLTRYEILESIGGGGSADVFAAREIHLDRPVAIKRMRQPLYENSQARQRFEREMQVVARIKHPNVVALIDAGEDLGHSYIVFELIEGTTLRQQLDQKVRISPERALRIAAGVATGLAQAHQVGVIHRDLKPDNILIDLAGVPKIADFGIALPIELQGRRLTQTGIVLGTPGYVAPELIREQAPTTAADLYSLGVLLFELLAGSVPFTGETAMKLLMRAVQEDAPRLSTVVDGLPAEIDRFVAQLLEREPANRPQDAREVAATLEELRRSMSRTPDGKIAITRSRSKGHALDRHSTKNRRTSRESNKRLFERIAAAVVVAAALTGVAMLAKSFQHTALPPPTARAGAVTVVESVAMSFVNTHRVRYRWNAGDGWVRGIRLGDAPITWAPPATDGHTEETVEVDIPPSTETRPVHLYLRREPEPEVIKTLPDLTGPVTILNNFLNVHLNPTDLKLRELRQTILSLPYDELAISRAQNPPGEKLLKHLTSTQRALLCQRARALCEKWLRDQTEMSLDPFESAIGAVLNDSTIPIGSRKNYYLALDALSELSTACESICGSPLLNVAEAGSGLIHIRYESTDTLPIAPTTFFRPFNELQQPEVREIYPNSALPFFNHLDYNAIIDVAGSISYSGMDPAIKIAKALGKPDPGDPLFQNGIRYPIGTLPASLRPESGLTFSICAANLSLDRRICLQIGKTRILIHSHQRFLKNMLSLYELLPRAVVARQSVTITLEIPPGFLEPTDRDVSLRLEVFPMFGTSMHLAYPAIVWVSDLAFGALDGGKR